MPAAKCAASPTVRYWPSAQCTDGKAISGQGISQLLPAAVYVFSGMIIPVPLFPEWAQRILDFLPFRGLVDTPIRLYLGHIPPSQLWSVLGHQLLWVLAFVALGRWLLARGVRRLVVQGG